jgi:uncharacterized protein YbcI
MLEPTANMIPQPFELTKLGHRVPWPHANARRAAHRSFNLPGDYCWGAGDERFDMPTESAERARQATAVGNAITRLHRERYGRGATTTRTVFERDHVVAFLEDIYTPLERTLIDAGDWEQVKTTRQAFQMAMRAPFSAAVEDITGRKVVAFMSQVHLDPDMAAEIFVLEPNAAG